MGKTVTQSFLDDIKEDVKDHIEANFNYMGFGSGTANPVQSVTALTNEFVRISSETYFESSDSTTSSFYLSASQGNGNTIREIGTFDTTTAGANEMQNYATLSITIDKTSDIEVWVDTVVDITVTEN